MGDFHKNQLQMLAKLMFTEMKRPTVAMNNLFIAINKLKIKP